MRRLIVLCVWIACVSMAAQAIAQCNGAFCARRGYAMSNVGFAPQGGAYGYGYGTPGVSYPSPTGYGRVIPWQPVRNAIRRIFTPSVAYTGRVVGVARSGGVMYTSASRLQVNPAIGTYANMLEDDPGDRWRINATTGAAYLGAPRARGWYTNNAGFQQWGPNYPGVGGGVRYANMGYGGAGVPKAPCNRVNYAGGYCRR